MPRHLWTAMVALAREKANSYQFSPWLLIGTDYPAKIGTNWTSFTHSNIVVYPPPCGTNSGGGSGGGPPGFEMMLANGESMLVTQDGEVLTLEELLPSPWNPMFQPKQNFDQDGVMIMSAESETQGDCPPGTNTTGFYRVKATRVLSGLTNGATVSGAISVAVRPDENVSYLRLLLDGTDFIGDGILIPPFTNTITFDFVDTARLTNGPHTFQVEGAWQYQKIDGAGSEKVLSAKFTMTTSNEFTFPEWVDDVGDVSAEFRIVSAHTNITWQIDIYNVYEYLDWINGVTSEIDPIKVLSGATNNGQIYASWNLVDVNGQTRTNVNDDPYFISFVTANWETGFGTAGATKPAPLLRQTEAWPSLGLWVITYQDFFRMAYDQDNLVTDMLGAWLGLADDPANTGNSVGVHYQPPIGGTNAQTFPIRYRYENTPLDNTNASFAQSIIHDSNLLTQMIQRSSARNLYYFGHGSPAFIGNGIYEPALRNSPKKHRYRFVWLDGCNTGKGIWDHAFGINGPGIFPLSHYQPGHRRPALFVGHDYEIPYAIAGERTVNGFTYIGTIPEQLPFFRSKLLFNWYFQNMKWKDARLAAINSVAGLGQVNIRYTTGAKKGQLYNVGDDMVWSGYEDLRFNEYNAKNALP